MTSPTHMRETTFHRASHQLRTSRLASLAATGTFLDHLPCTSRTAPDSPARCRASDIGITFQLLTLRAIDGERALEPKLGIPVPPGTDPAERFLLSGHRLLEATHEIIVAGGPDGKRRAEQLLPHADATRARVEITELISLQRRWGAASNGLAMGDRAACRIRPGVVLLGALLVRSASLSSLATLFAALDRAAAHGLPSVGHSRGACQFDVLSVAGGTLAELPGLTSLIRSQDMACPPSATAATAEDAWARAAYRLEGRDARRAASQLARMSSFNFQSDLPA